MDLYNKIYEYKNSKTCIYLAKKINDNMSTTTVTKNSFDNLIKILLKNYGKYTKSAEYIYVHDDLTYIIVNGKHVHVHAKNSLYSVLADNYVAEISNDKELDKSTFPILNKYSYVCRRNKMNFIADGFTVSLVTESHLDDPIYFVEIDITNISKLTKNKLDEIINDLKSNISWKE